MSVLKVTITARAPLVFSERRADGQFRPGTPYVPGSVIRGALAQQLIDASANADEATGSEAFNSLFTSAAAPLFRNAYPAYFDGEARASISSRTLPATAFSCKTESGFASQGGHGVFDSLIDRFCCERLRVRIPYRPLCAHADHKGRPERVEAFGGFYATASTGFVGVSVPRQLTTRVALNRFRKTAEDGLLYSPLVIAEAEFARDEYGRATDEPTPTTFHGSVVAEDAAARALVEKNLPELNHVGSGVARGFGRVEVAVEAAAAGDIVGRLESFNRLVAERWEVWERLPREDHETPYAPKSGTLFSVTLLADAVLRDGGWTPTVRLEPRMLGAAGEGATLLRCYATAEYRGGWNTAWRLPKDTELVARAGSVYLYHTEKRPEDGELLSALSALETAGVGERRAEGFGEVRVCDDFHREIQRR